MKILAFDTTNNSASVAISDEEDVLAYREEIGASMQAEIIVPMIEEALKISSLTYDDLNYLAITNGPGSFTGIRIGLAVAQGILVSTNIKGTIVTNFEYTYFRATQQVKNCKKIFIFLNAYRRQLYCQIFTDLGKASTPLLLTYEHAVDLITREEGDIACAGSGIELIYERIKDIEGVTILPRFARVKAFHICKYIADKIVKNQLLSHRMEPLYVRAADVKFPKLL